ncbi:30S ribosomal protein S5 [bacterium]|jgi:small subunit ribosomal protein S5|nr:30S ribosomal protein S5 [bacterium]
MRAHRGPKKPKEFQEAVIQIDRVTRVVKGGRRLRFRATVCIGNQKGKVGIGLGKSKEVTGAIQKAVAQAKKNMITIQLDQDTIAHEIQAKFKSANVLVKPASKGTGLIAGGAVRTVLELAGIKNILTKSLGSNNKINTTRATIEALKTLRVTPAMAKRLQTVQKEEQKVTDPSVKRPAKTQASTYKGKPATKVAGKAPVKTEAKAASKSPVKTEAKAASKSPVKTEAKAVSKAPVKTETKTAPVKKESATKDQKSE